MFRWSITAILAITLSCLGGGVEAFAQAQQFLTYKDADDNRHNICTITTGAAESWCSTITFSGAPVSSLNPLPVAVISGGGGGGGGSGGAVTAAANSYAAGAIVDLGTGATPGTYTVNGWLKALNVALGTPFQAGGSIGNTSFGAIESGPWNITNISGTISLPSGAATSALQNSANTLLVAIASSVAGPTPAGTNFIGTVGNPLPASPITGQQTLTTTATALPANALQNGLIVTALPTNSGTVFVGAAGVTTGTGYPLGAGQSLSFSVANSSGISIIGTNATDKIAFLGN